MFTGPTQDSGFFDQLIMGAVFLWPVTLLLILAMIAAIFSGLYKTFQKAGEKGWKSLIPFYNLYYLANIGGLKSWYRTTVVIPIIGLIIAFFLGYRDRSLIDLDALNQFVRTFSVPNIFVYLLVVFTGLMLIYLVYSVAKKFQKGIGFTLGLILLPFIFWPILGFGDAQYNELIQSKQAVRHD